MISFLLFHVGASVRDRRLGLVWTVAGTDGGSVEIRPNGVTTTVPIWDLESGSTVRAT